MTESERCPIHDTVLVQRFRIDGKWFLPTGEYYCSPCFDAQRPATTRPGDLPAALPPATAEGDRSVP